MTPLAHVECVVPLCAGLALAVVQDLRSRRIRNWLTAVMLAAGLAMWTASGGWRGLLLSGAGALACLGVAIVPFARGWLGAGDAKLLAAVGAWVGLPRMPMLVLFTAVAGGLVSAATLAWARGKTGEGDILARPRAVQVPYAIAIATGAVATAIMGGA